MWTLAVAVTVALLPCVFSQYNVATPQKWHVNRYPDPWWSPEDCNRDNKSAICDPNGIITKKEASEIDRLIEAVAINTRCPCYHCVSNMRGYVIRVALMEEMEPIFNYTNRLVDKLRNARIFAWALTKRWKLTGNCNETVLIVFSRKYNALYTYPGDQASKLLTDKLIVEITMDVKLFFDDEEMVANGLKEMIKRYSDVFNNKYNREEAGKVNYPSDVGRQRGGGSGMVTWSPILLLVTMVTLKMS